MIILDAYLMVAIIIEVFAIVALLINIIGYLVEDSQRAKREAAQDGIACLVKGPLWALGWPWYVIKFIIKFYKDSRD